MKPEFIDHILLMTKNVNETSEFYSGIFGVRTLKELEQRKERLDEVGMKRYQNREYIWFDDPDGIRQEFYLRPESEQ